MEIEFGSVAKLPSPPAGLTPEAIQIFTGEQSFINRLALRKNREVARLGLPINQTPCR